MGIRVKYLSQGLAIFLHLCLFLLSQPSSAQFRYNWQADIYIGKALTSQHEYYINEGYPSVSLIGNVKPGIKAQAQLMRNLNNWMSLGGGAAFTNFTSASIPNMQDRRDFALRTSMLNLSGKIYPLGRNHRLTPFLQINGSYGQVSLEHGMFTYTIDSLSRHSGNPDHPVLLKVIFTKPKASQKSNVLGFGGIAGAEFLLKDAVGLTWQAGYHTHKTEQMQLLGEDLQYWEFKLGVYFRMFKTKRFY